MAAIVVAVFVLTSSSRGGGELIIVSYNVQNLFDTVDDGTEYQDFTAAGGWTADAYHERLIRLDTVLSEMIRSVPDLIALQEIEGVRVVSDLLGDYHRRQYATIVSPGDTGATRVALLSRHPIVSARVHATQIVATTPAATPAPPVMVWSGRDMLDVEVDAPGFPVRLVVCHWKSQSGGEYETEGKRMLAAALVRTLLAHDGGAAPAIIVGDLNEDVDEYLQHNGAWPTALMPASNALPVAGAADARVIYVSDNAGDSGVSGNRVVAFSPWLVGPAANPGPGEPPGTYEYAGRWERLDQALVVAGVAGTPDVSLRVVSDDRLLDDGGTPARYDLRSGYGYSDHLPIVIECSWDEMY